MVSSVPSAPPDRWDVPLLVDQPVVLGESVHPLGELSSPGLAGERIPVSGVSPAVRCTEGDLCWVSTHGGAGASSLARAAGQRHVLSRTWPAPELGWPAHVILVARSNSTGMAAIGRFLHEWSRGRVPDVKVLAVAVNADTSSRPPRTVRDRIAETASVAPVVAIPWVETWRADPGATDRRMNDVLANLVGSQRKENS